MTPHSVQRALEHGERLSREEFMARWERMPQLKRAELIDGTVYLPSVATSPDRATSLANGERLSREEFMARWERIPSLKKAELIEGVVYLPSPVSNPHGVADQIAQLWAGNYCLATPGCECATNCTLHILSSSPQPDLAMWWLPEHGGRARVEGGYLTGPPELIVEVTGSSRGYDLGEKLDLYQRAGVQEYLAILLEEERVEWRALRGRRYSKMRPDARGLLESRVFPGLRLDPSAVFESSRARLVRVLRAGIRERRRPA